MRFIKKIFKYLILLTLLVFVFRGYVYRFCVNYVVVKERKSLLLSNKVLILKINEASEGKQLNIDEIITLSNKITSKNLSFTFNKISSNPNIVCKRNKANCIGYAALFSSIGNYLLKQNNLADIYEFKHLVGELYFLDINVHQFIDTPFFKDHDFNKILNRKTGEATFVDPSLSDYFMIDEVRSE